MYKGYSLTEIPIEAHPDYSKKNLGAHSYTLTWNGVTVEVLLRQRAFFIKKVHPDSPGPKGQVSFLKHGGAKAAWKVAVARSGFGK
eukprot:Skav227294  [mRNA]  locus=scaffold2645:5911:6168:+ [translate_table: standard]